MNLFLPTSASTIRVSISRNGLVDPLEALGVKRHTIFKKGSLFGVSAPASFFLESEWWGEEGGG